MVASGDADLGALPVSEIMHAHAAGVDIAGSIAPEADFMQTFSTAVVTDCGEIDAAKRLIQFLTSAHASQAIRKSGMEPPTVSK